MCLTQVAPGTETSPNPIGALRRTLQFTDRIHLFITDNLEQAHWEKLAWNIPFNGLGVASAAGIEAVRSGTMPAALQPCMTTDKLLDDPAWAQLLRELMMEIIDTARARKLPVAHSLADEQISRTRSMGAYKASTVLDFEQGREIELETLFLEPVRQARNAGVPAPRLSALCNVLQQLTARMTSTTI